MYCPKPENIFEKYEPLYKTIPWYIRFLLKFKQSFYISEEVTKNTTNYYEYKWLFGTLYAIDEYGTTTIIGE